MKHFVILGLSILSCSLLRAGEEVVLMTKDKGASSKTSVSVCPKAGPYIRASSKNPPTTCVSVCPEAGPYLSMEYLYWKAQQEQLDYCTLAKGVRIGEIGDSKITIKPHAQKFEYTSGFRATVGYDFNYEKYDACLAWTYLHPTTTGHGSQNGTGFFFVFPFQELTTSDVAAAESARSRWHLAFDMLDLELGRKFTVGKRFTIRPLIGLKGGWVNQSQHVSYKNVGLGGDLNIIEIVQGAMKRKNNFHGIGPRLGVDLRYGIGSEFGVFGTISGAALYGRLDMKTSIFLTDTLTNTGAIGGGSKMFIYRNDWNLLRTTGQLLIGVDWARCLYQKWKIRLGAAYETQIWWNQLFGLYAFTQVLTNIYDFADLWLHGLTVQARFDF